MPAEVTLPRTARIAPAVLLSASPCRVTRLTRFVRKRCPRFPSTAVMQPRRWRTGRPGRIRAARQAAAILNMAGWAIRAGRRREGANSPRPGRGRQQPFGRPVPDTGERVIYAECVAAGGQRSRMRPGADVFGHEHTRARGTDPEAIAHAVERGEVTADRFLSISTRPAHLSCRLARRQPSAVSPRASRPAALMSVERSRRTSINTRSAPRWVRRRKSLPHLHWTTGRTPGTSPLRPGSPMSRDQPLSRSR